MEPEPEFTKPEYYKKQAEKAKEQYEALYQRLKSKKNRTPEENRRLKDLINQEAEYMRMYNESRIRKVRLKRLQEASNPQATTKKSLIDLLKENEAKRKRQQLEQERLREEQERLREEQERMDEFLQRGVPTDEDVREDAANLGINIDEDLDDKNVEDELAELGGPDDLPNVPSHPIEIGKKPNIVIPPPPPPLTDEYDEEEDEDKDEDVNIPIQTPVKPSVKGLSSPPPPPTPLTTDNKPRPVSSTSSNQPELINFPPPPPPLQPPREDVKSSRKTKKLRLGFRETLKKSTKPPVPPLRVNPAICQDIFTNGSKVTKKYFYPSEFPKLTKIKPITVTMKKGGKRNKKSRKLIKKRNY